MNKVLESGPQAKWSFNGYIHHIIDTFFYTAFKRIDSALSVSEVPL